MDFPQSSYYKYNKTLLCLIGLWPYQGSFKKAIRYHTLNIILFTSILVQSKKIFRRDVTVQIICKVLPFLVIIITLLLFKTLMNNQNDKFEDLWLRIKKDWAMERMEEEVKIKKAYAEEGQYYTKILIYLAIVGQISLASVTPFASNIFDLLKPLNESRERMHLFDGDYIFIDEKQHFKIVTFYGQFVCSCGVLIGISLQSTFILFLQHIYGMFAALGFRLKNALSEVVTDTSNSGKMSREEKHYRSILGCIKYHHYALEFADIIEDYYSWPFVVTLGVSLLIIIPNLIQLSNFKILALLALVVVSIFLFLVNCMGQKLIDMSVIIAEET
ncbi:uncharacterized protein [Prorops nasuta]|uniref:uncharacterized protein n=1 Tax=Prorops nasuta TaxID=863751 RepID=UPI0034CF2127